MNEMETTLDTFLGGGLKIPQPLTGYRAATDPVFLAASVPAKVGQSVLELGCGVGVALLCLAHRVDGLQITGLEIQPEYVVLAQKNAQENMLEANIVQASLDQLPQEIRNTSYDHVIFNPPFYNSSSVSAPRDTGKSKAHVMEMPLADWINVALKRLKPMGRMTLIHRVEALPEILSCIIGDVGDLIIKPLSSRTGRPANRIIVSCLKGTKGQFKLLPPLIIHSGTGHEDDAGAYSPIAENILRNGAALPMLD